MPDKEVEQLIIEHLEKHEDVDKYKCSPKRNIYCFKQGTRP